MASYTDWSRALVFGIMILVIAAFLLTAGILFQAFMDGVPGRNVENRLVNTSYTVGDWTINIVDGTAIGFDGNKTLTLGVHRNDTNDTYTAVLSNCQEAYGGVVGSYPEYEDRRNPCPGLNQTIRSIMGLAG